uniref:Uncharacterized protein n=1 Tax=Oryza barthii TaxID=65489 RepID=A0A0D3F308_9ORYZ
MAALVGFEQIHGTYSTIIALKTSIYSEDLVATALWLNSKRRGVERAGSELLATIDKAHRFINGDWEQQEQRQHRPEKHCEERTARAPEHREWVTSARGGAARPTGTVS